MSKLIQTSWAPNVEKDDLYLSFSLLFRPWEWFKNSSVRRLEFELKEKFSSDVVAFDSGRSALFEIFNALNIGSGDEVLLQAFTCVALPNPIIWSGAKPVYADIDLENLNIDLEDLEKKITAKSKAVIIQYTFGICPDIERIIEICSKHNLLLIEDCCHNLGQKIKVNGKEYFAGTIGDAAIYSLGMEKVISATRAGFAISKDSEITKKLKVAQQNLKKPRVRDVLRGILNPLLWKAKESFGGFGNLIAKAFFKLKLFELGLTKLELMGKRASWLPYSLPNTNAILGLNQLKKVERFNKHRREVAEGYNEKFKGQNSKVKIPTYLSNEDFGKEVVGIKVLDFMKTEKYASSIWLRFPVIVENAQEVLNTFEKKNIYLGNWYTEVIHCKDVDLNALGYAKGSCPKVEWLVSRIVNLPTHRGIQDRDIEKIVELFN